jgi:dipeptidyl aminopeptidase/acylaminoacyl peptidase
MTWQSTFDPGTDSYPLWSPDGSRILFGSADGQLSKASDGAGAVERLAAPTAADLSPYAFSADGKTVVVRYANGLAMVSVQDGQLKAVLPAPPTRRSLTTPSGWRSTC